MPGPAAEPRGTGGRRWGSTRRGVPGRRTEGPCCTPRPWRRSLAGIRSGLFPPGSALPAERTPASRLRVSRGSLREALGACRRTPGPGHPDRQWHLIRESCGCGAVP
ncbi:GntR family transcriptional regulator [Streptomyces sp. B4I13]|uniref:GntR family transcriptional regulator n=1 Tax=Streptomyces sp. B4I13 TaxID=3042271 RepID=UPI0027D8988C|nr:GntR family transcriptional regulator [Streptomyces sp. B4I13]